MIIQNREKSTSNGIRSENSRDSGLDVREIELFYWHRTIRNNIILITIFNSICIVGNIFSITFYEWYQISDGEKTNKKFTWLNMLYVYDEDKQRYLSFQEYSGTPQNVCDIPFEGSSKENCKRAMVILCWIGLICFFFLLSSLILQLFDIFRLRRMLLYIKDRQVIKNKVKGCLIYTLVCIGQIGALLTYFITIAIYDISDDRFSIQNFGLSYWISVSCSGSMVIISLYYKWSKNRYHKFLETEKLENSLQLSKNEL